MLRRLLQLFIGLTLYGVSTAMFVRADLGADPWNVFHLGVANLVSMNIGVVIIAVGVLVLLAWIPLHQRPGFGTLSNVIMIGLAADVALVVIPGFESLMARSGLLVSAVILNALATSLYIGAGFGAGPRDGLMTGIHARTGWPVRRIRTAIEVSVLLIGWLLGGTVGVGTVLYALAIGPLIQICLPWFRHQPQSRIRPRNAPGARSSTGD
ncbi:YczE/YyaS/YitT family protein [Citrobacter meridianamericanus]|uniref:membrane protein YczE n=1 Tax=Citrobacter meridianamericanus TaxID=2894201 RepID=UPI0039BE49F8